MVSSSTPRASKTQATRASTSQQSDALANALAPVETSEQISAPPSPAHPVTPVRTRYWTPLAPSPSPAGRVPFTRDRPSLGPPVELDGTNQVEEQLQYTSTYQTPLRDYSPGKEQDNLHLLDRKDARERVWSPPLDTPDVEDHGEVSTPGTLVGGSDDEDDLHPKKALFVAEIQHSELSEPESPRTPAGFEVEEAEAGDSVDEQQQKLVTSKQGTPAEDEHAVNSQADTEADAASGKKQKLKRKLDDDASGGESDKRRREVKA